MRDVNLVNYKRNEDKKSAHNAATWLKFHFPFLSQDDVKAVAEDAAKLADSEYDAKLAGLVREAAGKECQSLSDEPMLHDLT